MPNTTPLGGEVQEPRQESSIAFLTCPTVGPLRPFLIPTLDARDLTAHPCFLKIAARWLSLPL